MFTCAYEIFRKYFFECDKAGDEKFVFFLNHIRRICYLFLKRLFNFPAVVYHVY